MDSIYVHRFHTVESYFLILSKPVDFVELFSKGIHITVFEHFRKFANSLHNRNLILVLIKVRICWSMHQLFFFVTCLERVFNPFIFITAVHVLCEGNCLSCV
jgi:hypothetical protein